MSVITVGLAGAHPGAADAWITLSAVTVREQFAADNRRISSLPGGEGGMASVVAAQANLSSTCAQLGASVLNLASEVKSFRSDVDVKLSALQSGVMEIAQFCRSRMSMTAPPPMIASTRTSSAPSASSDGDMGDMGTVGAGFGSTSIPADAISASKSLGIRLRLCITN
jgi:hypothetical protein